MSISQIYHNHSIAGFQYISSKYEKQNQIIFITRKKSLFRCICCNSDKVTATFIKYRDIKSLPNGRRNCIFRVKMHRIRCHICNEYKIEVLPFIPNSKARITKVFCRTIIELRKHMSIQAIAEFYNLRWHTVKEIEKQYLKEKYKTVRIKDVKYIGIDEIHIGKDGYITIVRDLETGAVIYVGKGKGGDALKKFNMKLRRSKPNIKAVTMDFANSYSSWARENIPKAKIIHDHFHLIQLMNKKLDDVRRQTMNTLDEDEKKKLKRKRYVLLKGEERLTKKAKEELEELKITFKDLSEMHMLKESLRKIYDHSESSPVAKIALEDWCEVADETGIAQMKTIAKTIRRNMKGILAYWDFNGLTNASMEGFNNKVRWLIRQAYGYRDEEYFRLKIFDLPKRQLRRIML